MSDFDGLGSRLDRDEPLARVLYVGSDSITDPSDFVDLMVQHVQSLCDQLLAGAQGGSRARRSALSSEYRRRQRARVKRRRR